MNTMVVEEAKRKVKQLILDLGFKEGEVGFVARVIREVNKEPGFQYWRFNREHRDIADRLVTLGLIRKSMADGERGNLYPTWGDNAFL